MYDKPLAIVFSLLILGQAYAIRLLVGTWLFPACLFGLTWFAFTFIPLVVLISVPVNPWGVAFILVCCLAFSSASLFWGWRPAFRRKAQDTAMYGSRFLRRAFYLSAVASVTFTLLDWSAQGFSLSSLIFETQASAMQYSSLHSWGNLESNIYEKLQLPAAYVCAALGGLIISATPRKRLTVALAFAPALLVGIAHTDKGSFFLCIAFFVGGLLAYRISAGNFVLITKGTVKRIALSLVLIVPLALAGFWLKNPVEAEELAPMLQSYSASYCCGHLYAFADWFSSQTDKRSGITYTNERAPAGFFTFPVVFGAIGYTKELPGGVFDDYFEHDHWLISNIYTMFRGLIMDFGLFGSVLFMFATGFLFHLAFRTILLEKHPTFTVAVFVFMLACFYQSFIISPLVSNRMTIAFAVLWTVLTANRWRLVDNRKRQASWIRRRRCVGLDREASTC